MLCRRSTLRAHLALQNPGSCAGLILQLIPQALRWHSVIPNTIPSCQYHLPGITPGITPGTVPGITPGTLLGTAEEGKGAVFHHQPQLLARRDRDAWCDGCDKDTTSSTLKPAPNRCPPPWPPEHLQLGAERVAVPKDVAMSPVWLCSKMTEHRGWQGGRTWPQPSDGSSRPTLKHLVSRQKS